MMNLGMALSPTLTAMGCDSWFFDKKMPSFGFVMVENHADGTVRVP